MTGRQYGRIQFFLNPESINLENITWILRRKYSGVNGKVIEKTVIYYRVFDIAKATPNDMIALDIERDVHNALVKIVEDQKGGTLMFPLQVAETRKLVVHA